MIHQQIRAIHKINSFNVNQGELMRPQRYTEKKTKEIKNKGSDAGRVRVRWGNRREGEGIQNRQI